MKTIMPFILTCLLVSGVIFLSCTVNTKGIKTPEETKQTIVYVTEYITEASPAAEEAVVSPTKGERPTRDVAIKEVVALWNAYYDDESISKKHKRRASFGTYAGYLVDAVRMYQEQDTDIGGRLPNDRHTHLVVATMAALESGVRPKVVGKSRGEVGLLQIHGKLALNGYTKKQVQRNPRLGLLLGVRWLAYHTQFCKTNKKGIDKWTKTLSLYGAGLSAGRKKDGTCKQIWMARRRVRLTKFYSTRIKSATKS